MSKRAFAATVCLVTALWSSGCCCTSSRRPEPSLRESSTSGQAKNRIQPAGIGDPSNDHPVRLEGKVGP